MQSSGIPEATFSSLTTKNINNSQIYFKIALTSNSAFAAATLLTCYAVVKEKPQLLRLDVALTEKICGDEPKVYLSIEILDYFHFLSNLNLRINRRKIKRAKRIKRNYHQKKLMKKRKNNKNWS